MRSVFLPFLWYSDLLSTQISSILLLVLSVEWYFAWTPHFLNLKTGSIRYQVVHHRCTAVEELFFSFPKATGTEVPSPRTRSFLFLTSSIMFLCSEYPSHECPCTRDEKTLTHTQSKNKNAWTHIYINKHAPIRCLGSGLMVDLTTPHRSVCPYFFKEVEISKIQCPGHASVWNFFLIKPPPNLPTLWNHH